MLQHKFRDFFYETPLQYSHPLSRVMDSNVYLKLEIYQPSGSFKNRGIGNYCYEFTKKGVTEFVCSSGGNAGIAAAFSARLFGSPITIVVPEGTSTDRIERIKQEKGEVIVFGKDWNDADSYARLLCEQKNACYVPPFDHPFIWKGHSTLIHEVSKSGFRPDAIVLAVGGGGLLCGTIQGVRDVGWPDIPIFAVETTGSASFAAAIHAGYVVEIGEITTVVKSLGSRVVAKQAVELAKDYPIYSTIVTDRAAIESCQRFAKDHALFVDPACGASLSLCYDRVQDLRRYDNILVVVCGVSDEICNIELM